MERRPFSLALDWLEIAGNLICALTCWYLAWRLLWFWHDNRPDLLALPRRPNVFFGFILNWQAALMVWHWAEGLVALAFGIVLLYSALEGTWITLRRLASAPAPARR